MRLLWIGVAPALVRLTDEMPEDVGGYARGPLVGIRPRYEADEGLLRHELTHVVWFWVVGMVAAAINGPIAAWLAYSFGSPIAPLQAGIAVGIFCLLFMYSILYTWSRDYRQAAEAAAYREQMRWGDAKGGRMSIEGAAKRLAGARYDLGITVDEARLLLQ